MQELKALIFDVDGTLADTEKAHMEAFNRAFRNAGLDWHWDTPVYARLLAVTGGRERIRHYIEQYDPEFSVPGDADAFIAALHADKTREYVAMMDTGDLGLRSGVERLFREARDAGLTLAIATTTTPANVTALIRNTLGGQALGWFAEIGAGDVVPHKKPAPDIYRYVLEHLGLPPAACLAFEDSENGVRSARAAGLPVLVTPNDFTYGQDFGGAVAVLDGFGGPGEPSRVLAGDCGPSRWVDVAMLRHLHRQAVAP